MLLEAFLDKVAKGVKVSFQDSMSVISANYEYTPTRFVNGCIVNEAGTNEGSCRLFYFAKLHGLTSDQTLRLFGDYYWNDVLEYPESTNHANIREFMKKGWAGMHFDGEPLREKV